VEEDFVYAGFKFITDLKGEKIVEMELEKSSKFLE